MAGLEHPTAWTQPSSDTIMPRWLLAPTQISRLNTRTTTFPPYSQFDTSCPPRADTSEWAGERQSADNVLFPLKQKAGAEPLTSWTQPSSDTIMPRWLLALTQISRLITRTTTFPPYSQHYYREYGGNVVLFRSSMLQCSSLFSCVFMGILVWMIVFIFLLGLDDNISSSCCSIFLSSSARYQQWRSVFFLRRLIFFIVVLLLPILSSW